MKKYVWQRVIRSSRFVKSFCSWLPLDRRSSIAALSLAGILSIQGIEAQVNDRPLTEKDLANSSLQCYRCDLKDTFYIKLEALYWRAFESELCTSAQTNLESLDLGNDEIITTLDVKKNDPEFNWALGYRIGAGYRFESQGVDIGLTWTRLQSKADDTTRDVDLHWVSNFEQVDLTLDRDISCKCGLGVRPFAGLRFAYTKQYLWVTSFNLPESSVFTESSSEQFGGIGPLVGVEADWYVGCGFSLFSITSFSNLFGNFYVHMYNTETLPSGSIDHFNVNQHLFASQLVFDAGIGVKWNGYLPNCQLICFRLSLESHRFFNHNKLTCNGTGDLSLDGVSFTATINF